MEEKFIAAWMQARQTAKELGVRMRPMEPSDALRQARYCLDSHRVSDGFEVLADKGRLDLTLEALAVDKRFTALFTDDQANTALGRLLENGYYHQKSTKETRSNASPLLCLRKKEIGMGIPVSFH